MWLLYPLTVLALTLMELASANSNLFIIPTPSPTSNKVTASIDDSFVLSCVSAGSSEDRPKALQWRAPNNQPITADSNRRLYTILNGDTLRLYFDKLVPSDSGTYTCVGIQAGVPQEARADLVLQKRISFYDTPGEQFLKAGLDQYVVCRAQANPGPEIAWFRKGVNVELRNTDAKYAITNDGLLVKRAQPEDEGVYYCQASVTSTGEVRRTEISVQVMSAPRWIVEPRDTEGVRGQDALIKCEAFAKPAPVYTWLRNGVALAGARYHVGGGTLTVRNLERDDTATYTCIAENNSGRVEANLKLYVLIGPEIALMDDMHVVEGNAAYLRCNVREAFPKATIRWKYTDTQEYLDASAGANFRITTDESDQEALGKQQPAAHGSIVQGSWSQLNLERASRFDKRNYTCVASNKAATSERWAQLLVEYAPKLILNQEAREVYYSWLFTDDFGSSGSASAQQSVRSYPTVLTCLADAEPKPLITWYFKGYAIKVDNIKYRLLRDEPSLSKLEVNPRSITDFGDYQCRAENRLGKEERNIQLREASVPRFAPLLQLRAVNPESVLFDIHPSDAPDADGGMPIEAYRVQWRLLAQDWTKPNEKEIPLDLTSVEVLAAPAVRDMFNVEIGALQPDTEYVFRAAAVNKPGVGVWLQKEIKIRTAPRRQPDPVKVISKEDCQAATRCYIEWSVDSNGGSPIREYLIRWRRISYRDPLNQHVNTDLLEPWAPTRLVKEPITNFEILSIEPNSFYEVDVLARNDIGPSASQPFRIRTLPSSQGDSEAFEKRNAYKISKALIIAGALVGALLLLFVIDFLLFIRLNWGLVALVSAHCTAQDKSADFKSKPLSVKIATKTSGANGGNSATGANNVGANSSSISLSKHQAAKNQYQPISQESDDTKVSIPMNE